MGGKSGPPTEASTEALRGFNPGFGQASNRGFTRLNVKEQMC
jgi:hypothetical protein